MLGVIAKLAVKCWYVRDGSYKDEQNVPEALRVVDAVLGHIIKRPDESLGVVTFNQAQQDLIEELLGKTYKKSKEVADFINRWDAEGLPFFVKSLEDIQNDEREVIFISTTFGMESETKRTYQNFGILSRPDGYRRLKALFTCSKGRIELFTSMVQEDIVVDKRTPLGAKALRDCLDYMSQQG